MSTTKHANLPTIPVTLHVTEEVEHEISTTIPSRDLEELRAQGVDLTNHAAVVKAWIEDLDTDDGVITDVIGDQTVQAVTERHVAVALRHASARA